MKSVDMMPRILREFTHTTSLVKIGGAMKIMIVQLVPSCAQARLELITITLLLLKANWHSNLRHSR